MSPTANQEFRRRLEKFLVKNCIEVPPAMCFDPLHHLQWHREQREAACRAVQHSLDCTLRNIEKRAGWKPGDVLLKLNGDHERGCYLPKTNTIRLMLDMGLAYVVVDDHWLPADKVHAWTVLHDIRWMPPKTIRELAVAITVR